MNVENLGKVYIIISPTKKFYVGSTKQTFEERWSHYYKLQCKSQIKLYRSFLKYGVENHIFCKAWVGSIDKMYIVEAIIGDKLRCIDNGLNIRLPKINDVYKNVSDETREKLSISGKNRSEEVKEKIREYARNRPKEINSKISKTLKGRKQNLKQIENAAKTRHKMVIQMDMNENFIKEWASPLEASQELGFNPENIRRCCRKIRNSYKKFKWKYKDERTN